MDDVKKNIIRTTIKNENLLQKKLENQRIKKINKRKSNAKRQKAERSSKHDGILKSKIEQSISRARYIQSSRRSNWDQINDSLRNLQKPGEEQSDTGDKEIEEEDEYVKQFFNGNDQVNEQDKQNIERSSKQNKFSLLEEAEA